MSVGNNFLFTVINVTLPDEKQNYVHRIGRVGRAERYGCDFVSPLWAALLLEWSLMETFQSSRMGLAISLVATEKEKVIF